MLHKYFFNNFSFSDTTPFAFSETTNKKTLPLELDLLVTRYNCEENEQKTLHNYAMNQVTQC